MQYSMLRLEMLKEGRGIRLPILLIFYNSIMAFLTILFIFFNDETSQAGYYSGGSSFLMQFLIISSIQILAVFVMMPFFASFMEESERKAAEQFLVIPGMIPYHIFAKISVLVLTNILIFLSSLPILSLSCIYSSLSFLKLIRLFGTIAIFSFWSGSVALFFYSISRRPLMAFAGTIFTYFMFTVGILVVMEAVRSTTVSSMENGQISMATMALCLILNLLSPLSLYVGYYESFAGNIPLVTSYFGNFGINVTQTTFSFLYFKIAAFVCLLVGLGFLWLAVHFFHNNQ